LKTKKGISAKSRAQKEFLNRRFNEEFDNASPDGLYTRPYNPKSSKHNLRAIDRFCSEHNIDPSDLTAEQLKQFEIR